MKRNSLFTSRYERAVVIALTLALTASLVPARAVTPVGGIATDFTITNHKTSRPLELYSYRGNVVLLDFWAYWCEYCAAAAPDIETNIVQYYRNNEGNKNGVPVTVISVSIDTSDPAEENAYIAEYGLELVGDDGSGVAYNQFGDGYIPYFVVLNGTTNSTNWKTWEVLYSTSGYTRTDIRTAIDSVQTTAPVCTLTPTNGACVSGSNVTLTAGITTNGKQIKKVCFFSGSTLLGLRTNAPYTCTWTNVAAGSQSAVARAYYGTSSFVSSPTVSFFVGTPPVCALTAPTNGAVFSGASVALAANVTSNGVPVTAVQFLCVSNAANCLLGAVTNPPYSLTWSNVPAGSQTVFAQVLFGSNMSASSSTVSFTVASEPVVQQLTLQATNVVLKWSGGPGTFQVQTCSSLTNGGWTNLGSATTATNLTVTATNCAAFYRILRQ